MPSPSLVNENEVRAAAGLTMVIGAVGFAYAYFTRQYLPLQVAASLFFVEFLVRLTAGLGYSPIGVVAHRIARVRPPEWVALKPKRFAWTLGLGMALAMTVITNVGIRGLLPRTMCLICLALMWMESALGLCLGCKIYGLLLRRGWVGADQDSDGCARGACEPVADVRERVAQPSGEALGRMLHNRRHHVAAIVAVLGAVMVGALLALVSSATAAAPGKVGFPVRKWSVSKIEQGVGRVMLGQSTVRSDDLDKVFDLGVAAFDLGPIPPLPTRAAGEVFSRNDGRAPWVMAQAPVVNPFEPHSGKGGVAHLDQYQTYQKPSKHPDKFLIVSITDLLLQAVDENGALTQSECPVVGTAPCPSIQSLVRFRVRAFPPTGGHDFFDSGGAVYAAGHEHAWSVGAVTLPDSRRAFFPDSEFAVSADLDHNGSGRRLQVKPAGFGQLVMQVPLRTVGRGQQFVVKVTLEAETVDDRGHESGALAFVQDPQNARSQVMAAGLKARSAPKFTEPPLQPRPAATCPAGPSKHAGTVQLSGPAFTVNEASSTPLVLVTRKGGSRGATSVTVQTSGGTARSGHDFTATKTLVRFENGDTSPRLVAIPIREDLTTERPERFTVSLSHVRCAKLGKQRTASVTILDDDQPPPPPPPTFTIGGTVDGLQGSGLVLSNLGGGLPVSANGSFTLPGTHTTGEPYEVKVASQPRNPDQLCTVENGAGHVADVNVTSIAVHCHTTAVPSGLDTTFGSGGRVTTPGSGDGDAVLVQPDGHIVTVGPREVGNNFHFQFGATRHDAAGNLDPGFGTGGIVTTSLGGNDDKAFDAAMFPDGGFVAVGQADPAGLANTDFGIVRYTATGQPDPSFNTDGVLTSDLSGRDDVANAVAVQPDGKIIAAGLAEASPANFDFALARYNPDGTLDHSFGGDGIVTTDLGSFHDGITDIALQPEGKIVAVGATEQDAALARYNPDGTLDSTFGHLGTVVGGINTNEVKGIALTPGGTILIAGSRGGPKGGLDPIVASYAPNGSLNLGFGQGGVAQADLSGGTDSGDDLVVEPSGDIVLVGSASSTTTVSDMALVRFKPDGTLDTFLTADFTGFGEFGHALTIDSQGRIVAAGTADGFALMRAFL